MFNCQGTYHELVVFCWLVRYSRMTNLYTQGNKRTANLKFKDISEDSQDLSLWHETEAKFLILQGEMNSV